MAQLSWNDGGPSIAYTGGVVQGHYDSDYAPGTDARYHFADDTSIYRMGTYYVRSTKPGWRASQHKPDSVNRPTRRVNLPERREA